MEAKLSAHSIKLTNLCNFLATLSEKSLFAIFKFVHCLSTVLLLYWICIHSPFTISTKFTFLVIFLHHYLLYVNQYPLESKRIAVEPQFFVSRPI